MRSKVRRVTLDEFLTWPLHKRIEWLRKKAGSHDKLAVKLGTTRQTVIGWEKGKQPNASYRKKLAVLSKFPADSFLRSGVEREVWALTENRLLELEALVARLYVEAARGFEALGYPQHGLGDPGAKQSPGGVQR